MSAAATRVIPAVLEQHVVEAAHLASIRSSQVCAPNMDLYHLGELDERIAAHVEGLLVAGEQIWPSLDEALDPVRAGELFAATVTAIETQQTQRLYRLLGLAESVPEARDGLLAAFGWVSGPRLQGIGSSLLASPSAFHRYVGVAACAMHRMDPGPLLIQALNSPDALLRARAFRAAGELGRRELVSVCTAGVRDNDTTCRFWAAWSAVLLGDRAAGLEALVQIAQQAAPVPRQVSDAPAGSMNTERFSLRHVELALELAMLALDPAQARAVLAQISSDPYNNRLLIRGCGLLGNPAHMPWLIEQMHHAHLARAAGDAFSTITGADIDLLDLDGEPIEAADAGPTDDPEDDYVDMDPDEDLAWPDAAKVLVWWQANEARFSQGGRIFMGSSLTPQCCMDVLRTGYQHQRRVAALHLALINTGGTLFEWRAPAWRQQRKLA
jgi:uncharacterized protein (TIGR02270 family)